MNTIELNDGDTISEKVLNPEKAVLITKGAEYKNEKQKHTKLIITDDQFKRIQEIINEKDEQPQEFRKGQLVEVSNNGRDWSLRKFDVIKDSSKGFYIYKCFRDNGNQKTFVWIYCRQSSWEILARTWAPKISNWATIDCKGVLYFWEEKPEMSNLENNWVMGKNASFVPLGNFHIDLQYLPENFDCAKAIIEL